MKRRWQIGIVATVIVVAAVFPLVPSVLELSARLAGYNVHVGGMSLNFSDSRLHDVSLEHRGATAHIAAIEIHYRPLRIVLDHPEVLVQHPSSKEWDLPYGQIQAQSPPTTSQAAAQALPNLNFALNVRNGSLTIHTANAALPVGQKLSITHISIEGVPNAVGDTHLKASGIYEGMTVVTQAQTDYARGRIVGEVSSPRLPLAGIVNAIVDNPAFVLDQANGQGVRFGLVLTGHDQGPVDVDYYGHADISAAQLRVQGLVMPLRNVAGPVELTSTGITSPHLQGTLAEAPFSAYGGMSDLQKLRLHLRAHIVGEASRLRGSLAALAQWPLHGTMQADLDLSGPLAKPLFLVRITSRHLEWNTVALEEPHTDFAVHGNQLALLSANARSGSAQAELGGTVGLGGKLQALLVGHGTSPLGRLQAAVALEDRGGDAVAIGERAQAGLAAAGRMTPDRSHAWAAGVMEQTAGGAGLAMLQLEQGLTIAGAQLNQVSVPQVVESVGGSVDMAALGPRQYAVADLRATGLDQTFLARLFPTAPIAVFPHDVNVRADGDPRALAISHAEVTGGPYRIEAQGVAGEEHSALIGSVHAQLSSLSPLVRGRVSGPFALMTQGKQIDIASPGLEIAGGDLAGIAVNAVQGHVHIGKETTATLAVQSQGGVATTWGRIGGRMGLALNDVSLPSARLQGVQGRVDAMGWLDGSNGHAGFLMHNGLVKGVPLGGIGVIARSGDQAELSSGALRVGTVLASLVGTFGWGKAGSAYDVQAKVDHAEIASLLTNFVPQSRPYAPEASLSADVHVQSRGTDPQVIAAVQMSHGSISDYPLRNGKATIIAGRDGISLHDGSVDAGESHLRFAGSTDRQARQFRVQATAIDIGGLVDAFAPQYSAQGFGTLSIIAGLNGSQLTSMGTIEFTDLRWNDLKLGHAFGHWSTDHGWIGGHLGGAGEHTRIAVDGKIAPHFDEHLHLQPSSQMALVGNVTNLDLASRLALTGIHAPISGSLDAQTQIQGTLGMPRAMAKARLHEATLIGMPVLEASLDAALAGGKVELRQAKLVTADVVATANGTLSRLAPTAPFTLVMQANSAHLQAFLHHVFGRVLPVDGVASTRLNVDGTMRAPHFSGALAVDHGTIGALPVNEALARYEVKGSALQIGDAELDLSHGSITAAGSLPLTLAPFAIGPANAPLALQVGVNGVDLASLASFLPTGSAVAGQLNGAMALEGTPSSPQLLGALRLSKGSLEMHPQTSIENLTAIARFSGTSATLQAGAKAGSGQFALHGFLNVPNLTDLTSPVSSTSLGLVLKTDQAHLNMPGIGEGTLNGKLALHRNAGQVPRFSGDMTLTDAVIPAASLMNQQTTASAPPSGLVGETSLALKLQVRQGVRMRSGAIDIGANGAAQINGTVANPTVAGTFIATGGTVTYLNRSFRVQQGRVVFDPGDGLKPLVDATATTVVTNPDPSSIRNSSGQATITLNIHGQPDHLIVALSSDPSYSREQILGLLLDASLVRAVDFNSTDASKNGGLTQLNQAGQTGQVSLQSEALGLLDAQVTQSLLSPLTSALGGAVGLSDLGVSIGTTGSVGLTARRRLNGNLSLFFEESIGMPTRTSLGIDLNPNEASALSLSIYQDEGTAAAGRNGAAVYEPGRLAPVSAGGAGSASSNGILLSIRRRFP